MFFFFFFFFGVSFHGHRFCYRVISSFCFFYFLLPLCPTPSFCEHTWSITCSGHTMCVYYYCCCSYLFAFRKRFSWSRLKKKTPIRRHVVERRQQSKLSSRNSSYIVVVEFHMRSITTTTTSPSVPGIDVHFIYLYLHSTSRNVRNFSLILSRSRNFHLVSHTLHSTVQRRRWSWPCSSNSRWHQQTPPQPSTDEHNNVLLVRPCRPIERFEGWRRVHGGHRVN